MLTLIFTDFSHSWYWHQWQRHCWWRWGYFHWWTFFDSTILPKVTQWRPHLRRARFTSYLDGRDRRWTAPWTRTDDSRTGNRKCNVTGTYNLYIQTLKLAFSSKFGLILFSLYRNRDWCRLNNTKRSSVLPKPSGKLSR